MFAVLLKLRFFFFLSWPRRREAVARGLSGKAVRASIKAFQSFCDVSNAGVILVVLFWAGLCFCPAAAAQSLEEMQTLRLFYKDKDLVVTATRNPKPISQVAENITVITAGEIEAMNAHSVAEVLNRVPGLFIDFNQDFGATSLIQIQGSKQRHVLVLVDGITWNFLSEGSAETNSIPVEIIDRIEIIKGPASSAWGSSLGGVINILTKEAGTTAKPAGAVKVSYGERNTQDYSAQVAGLAGSLGYHLFAGRQDSKGIRDERKFDATSLFAKFNLPLTEDTNLGLTMGFSKPRNKLGDFPGQNVTMSSDLRSFFGAAFFNSSLTPELDLNLSAHTVGQNVVLTSEMGILSPPTQLFSENSFDEQNIGVSGKLVWTGGKHTAVLGIDADRGTLDQTVQTGPFLQQFFGQPANLVAQPSINKWALYMNDTIALDRWSLTPGLRYDHNDIIGSFVSPSLGATYKLGEATVARATVARGFTIPPLSWTSAGGLLLPPNPSLKHESIWSYQAGLESSAVRWLWIKGTVFYHDLEDALTRPPTFNSPYVNQGAVRRLGLELEAETVPFYNFSATAGFAYVHIKTSEQGEAKDVCNYNVGLKYDDRKDLRAQLFGHSVWWDANGAYQADYGTFIWDLNLARQVFDARQYRAEIFLTVHNLLNGSQYTYVEDQNPARWVEGGIRLNF